MTTNKDETFFITCKCGESVEHNDNCGWEHVVCPACKRWGCFTLDEDQQTDDPTAPKTERWRCTIEFTFKVDTEPSKERHEGDAPIDFAYRAFWEGLRPRLDKAFPGDDGINWGAIADEDRIVARRIY